jgi:hypothetical protein
MSYKRLTKQGLDWQSDVQCDDEKIYNRLTELEDKIENGTLIELPCKVGDTVWRWLIRDCYDEWTVDKICIYVENGRIDYTLVCTSKSGCGMDYFYKDDKDIDWTFNNPKAEAEKKLKELSKNT